MIANITENFERFFRKLEPFSFGLQQCLDYNGVDVVPRYITSDCVDRPDFLSDCFSAESNIFARKFFGKPRCSWTFLAYCPEKLYFNKGILMAVKLHRRGLFKSLGHNFLIKTSTPQVIVCCTPFVEHISTGLNDRCKKIFYVQIMCRQQTEKFQRVRSGNYQFTLFRKMTASDFFFDFLLLIFSGGLALLFASFRKELFSGEELICRSSFHPEEEHTFILDYGINVKISLDEFRRNGEVINLLSRYELPHSLI